MTWPAFVLLCKLKVPLCIDCLACLYCTDLLRYRVSTEVMANMGLFYIITVHWTKDKCTLHFTVLIYSFGCWFYPKPLRIEAKYSQSWAVVHWGNLFLINYFWLLILQLNQHCPEGTRLEYRDKTRLLIQVPLLFILYLTILLSGPLPESCPTHFSFFLSLSLSLSLSLPLLTPLTPLLSILDVP